MKKFSPFFKVPVLVIKCVTGFVAIVLLSSCSSPTKYPPRSPAINWEQPASLKNTTVKSDNLQVHDGSVSNVESSPCGTVYRVKSGDSLSEIAYQCRVSMKQLATFNKISPPYVIYKNQRLQMPGQAMPLVSKKQAVAVKNIARMTPQKKTTQQGVERQVWQWPVHKSLPYRFIQDGEGLSVIDIYGVAGQDIYAVASGSVVYAGEGIINFGKMLVIKHDDAYMSVYAHNSALLVKEGERVQAGQHIAVLGATGNASQPKLYLEARFKGRKIDIKKVLTPPNE